MDEVIIYENPNKNTIEKVINELLERGYTPYIPVFSEDKRAGMQISLNEALEELNRGKMIIFDKYNDFSYFVYNRNNKLIVHYRTSA